MASYYYLISSLPMLTAGSAMPFSYEEFLSKCEATVSSSTYESLKNLSVNSDRGPLVEEWHHFYGVLSAEMAYQRNLRLERPAQKPAECDDETSRTVTAAINAKNPLEAELMLLNLEFSKLDSLIGLHSFDDYTLFGYALKLKLLQRLTVFDKEKGKAEFARLFDGIQAQILSV